MENYYEILKVAPTCTLDELRVNYKKLLLQYHPDKIKAVAPATPAKLSDTVKSQAQLTLAHYQYPNDENEKFLSITEAWNCLKDPIKRKQYDAELMLRKFQMHSNIYAHIDLSDMMIKKYSSTQLDDSDADVRTDLLDKVEGKQYYYTYNCRCGGQYILNYDDCNESVGHQQEQAKHDYGYEGLTNNQNSVIIEDNGKEQTKACNCSNAEEVIAHKNNHNNNANNINNVNNDNNNNDDDDDDNDEEQVKEETIDKQEEEEAENKEMDTEFIVECNECSLAIVVNV